MNKKKEDWLLILFKNGVEFEREESDCDSVLLRAQLDSRKNRTAVLFRGSELYAVYVDGIKLKR